MRTLLFLLLALTTFTSAESLLFIGDTAETATATLLREPSAAPVLRSASLETSYDVGKDFTWQPGTRELRLLKGSRIPFLTPAQLHPAPKSPNAYASNRDGKSWMLFGPGHWFHDRQCQADYPSEDSWQPPPILAASEAQLGQLREKLRAKKAVHVVMLGDSISTGADASAIANVPPFQPGYPDLVVRGLRQRSGADITLKNLSVGGKTAMWGVQQVGDVLAEKPDLVILAFGMNDASQRRTPEQFASTVKAIFDPVMKALPQCAVLLVSSMTANAEWKASAPELYPAYATALKALTGPRIAHADVTTRWTAIEARKKTLDLTGNGLNHPNDYGHQIYAQVLLDTLLPTATTLRLDSPQDHQIIQQDEKGSARIKISGSAKSSADLEWRVDDGDWQKGIRSTADGHFEHFIVLQHGWHSLAIRQSGTEGSLHVPRFGIGEVFVIAGQSNSANSGPEKLRSESGHVSTFDGHRWRIAHDPQPGASGAGGSFAPAFGDELHRLLGVPIGIACVGIGATSVREWLPAGSLIERRPTTGANVKPLPDGRFEVTGAPFARLSQRLQHFGTKGIRAILWHQGESDASQAKDGYPADRQISPEDYTRYMRQLIAATHDHAGWRVPWLNALATYHSTKTPGDPDFRAAQASLRTEKLTHPGPDTDNMIGTYRAPDGIHFSALGLREHGRRWAWHVTAWLKNGLHTQDFAFPWSSKPAPHTDFLAWSDTEHFHFRFHAEDPDIILQEKLTGESTLDVEDRVELFFASKADSGLKNYWVLEIDPLGRVHDYHAQHYRKFDHTWNCPGLKTTARRLPNGYEVTASIPLKTLTVLLGEPIHRSSELRLGLFRAEFYGKDPKTHGESNDNWLSWIKPDTKQPDFHVPSAFHVMRVP